MEKVTLYVRKILALIFSYAFLVILPFIAPEFRLLALLALPLASLLFAFLNFRITGDKPKFLFGLTQSDAFLTKKGGFWNLFKWIVNSLGFLYDLVVWSIWGVYLLFVLVVDFIMLLKFIAYWIIHAIIWFIRQLFPPFIFLFKIFIHYIINWIWWLYQAAFRNMKISVNRNFYFIALWGTIPAIFIVFLFYAISEVAGIEQLVAVSAIFALIPLVWSYGEISALRYEGREKDPYSSVRLAFRNGWDVVKSILFYVILALILVIAEIVLNMMGWIPNLSMSLIGISINLNMAISFVLIFLTIILVFADGILPSHILYHPEHENDLNSSLGFLKVIGQKFLRYLFVQPFAWFFGGLLLVIPFFLMVLTFGITDNIKDSVMDSKIENLQAKVRTMEALDEHRTQYKINRLNLYKEIPENAEVYFGKLRYSGDEIDQINENIVSTEELLVTRKGQHDSEINKINASIRVAESEVDSNLLSELKSQKISMQEDFTLWEDTQKECIAFLDADLREQRSVRVQMPILYLFVGIFFAVFGGMVVAVFIAYLGNVYFEMYNFREDDKPTYWRQTINELSDKNGNQPLLGFTFLVVIIALPWILDAIGVLSITALF